MLQLTTSYPTLTQINWNIPNVNSNPELFFSFDYLRQVVYDLKTWSQKAEEEHFDISSQLNKIKHIVENMPEIKYPEKDWQTQIILIYQNKMHRYYLCKIARGLTLNMIEKFKIDGLKKFESLHKSSKNGDKKLTILATHHWLLKQLPEKVNVLQMPKNYENLTNQMIQNCSFILNKIEKMRKHLKIGDT